MCDQCIPPEQRPVVTIETIAELCRTIATDSDDLVRLGDHLKNIDTDTFEGEQLLEQGQQDFYYAKKELNRDILRLRATLTNY